MKVHILYDIGNKAWGGGNQFLYTLKNYLISKNEYEYSAEKADVIIVNSKDNLLPAINFKKQGKTCIHRVNGVFSLYRGPEHVSLDKEVHNFINNYADGVIYQSQWAKEQHHKMGAHTNIHETVIYNCAKQCFYDVVPCYHEKITFVATSWSNNLKKGFALYKHLDSFLDFNKYDFLFIGRSPIAFKHIRQMGVLESQAIADIYSRADIYITGTVYDACSNAIVEALAAKLPAIAINSGGNAELVKNGGIIFDNIEDVIEKIEAVCQLKEGYKSQIRVNTVADTCEQYREFIRCCLK